MSPLRAEAPAVAAALALFALFVELLELLELLELFVAFLDRSDTLVTVEVIRPSVVALPFVPSPVLTPPLLLVL